MQSRKDSVFRCWAVRRNDQTLLSQGECGMTYLRLRSACHTVLDSTPGCALFRRIVFIVCYVEIIEKPLDAMRLASLL